MGWVDDALEHLKQICPDDLKPAVETLRQGWDFVVGYYPDPAVLRNQRDTLSDLRDRGNMLLSQYTDSIIKLQQTWQGDLAAQYLPPSVTAFQVEHDLEPPDTSASTKLSDNLLALARALDHNQGTHNHWADQFDDMRDKQTTARGTIIAVAAINIGTDWIPVWGEIDLPASITAASITIGEIMSAVWEFLNTYKIIIIIATVAVGLGVTFDELVLPHLLHQTMTMSITWRPTLAPLPRLTPEQQAAANELFKEFGGKIPQAYLEYLLKIIGTGVSLETAKAMIRCLFKAGYLALNDTSLVLNANYQDAWNSIIQHLDPNDLEGAWKDNNPSQVDTTGAPPGTTSGGDHAGEVNAALRSLKNLINSLGKKINYLDIQLGKDPGNTDLANSKAWYQSLKNLFQNLYDWANGKIGKGTPPPTTWPDGGKIPFGTDLLTQSTCATPAPDDYNPMP
jgi:hypothetical protein